MQLKRQKKNITKKGCLPLRWIIASLLPFGGIFVALKLRKELIAAGEQKGAKIKLPVAALVISGIVLPILPVNVVALAMLQGAANKIYAVEE